MLNSKHLLAVFQLISVNVLIDLCYCKPPLTELYVKNQNCGGVSTKCQFDYDCCEPAYGDYGSNCLTPAFPTATFSTPMCVLCKGPQCKCMSERDCCNTLSCDNHLCCSPQNGHCVEDSDCCQGNLSNANKRSVCRGTGSKVPGQSAKCGRAKPGDTVNLANMTFAIKNAVYQDPTKVSQSDLQSLKDALASRDDNPDDM